MAKSQESQESIVLSNFNSIWHMGYAAMRLCLCDGYGKLCNDYGNYGIRSHI